MSSGTVTPTPLFQGLLDNGDVNNGGFLDVYDAGTLVRATTYSDPDLTVPNANPIELDSAGRALIYLGEQSVDYVMKDSLGNIIWGPITVSSVTVGQEGGIGEIFTLGGTKLSLVTQTAYPAGATLDKLHDDSVVWEVDSSDLPGTYALEVCLKSNDGANAVTVGLVNLSDGSPDAAMVECTSTSSTGEPKTSTAIVFPAGGTTKRYGIKVKVAALLVTGGLAWGARIVRLS